MGRRGSAREGSAAPRVCARCCPHGAAPRVCTPVYLSGAAITLALIRSIGAHTTCQTQSAPPLVVSLTLAIVIRSTAVGPHPSCDP